MTATPDDDDQGNGEAELQLWCAVLGRLIDDARREITSSTSARARDDIMEARAYLTKPNKDFNIVCSLAGLDPAAVRDRLLRPFKERGPIYATDQTRGRPSIVLTFDGASLTIEQWAARTGINVNTLQSRLAKHWTVERALTEPVAWKRGKRKPGVGSNSKVYIGTGDPPTTQDLTESSFSE